MEKYCNIAFDIGKLSATTFKGLDLLKQRKMKICLVNYCNNDFYISSPCIAIKIYYEHTCKLNILYKKSPHKK